MKKKFLIPIVFLTAMAYSCVNNQSDNNTFTSVNGVYSIGGAEANGDEKLVDSLRTVGILDFKNSEFKFADNDSVYIDSESAKKFFNGSTAYKYEFIEKKLVLTDNMTKIEIPVSVSKDFRNMDLEINFSGIKKIGLMRMNIK